MNRAYKICTIMLSSILMVTVVPQVRAGVDETNRYLLRIMTQTFDGTKEFSFSQTAGVARMRKGDESYLLMDFHDGAVVIEKPGRTALGNFRNTSGVEAEFKYNYQTQTLSGHNASAKYFNTYVRPFLGGNPKPGVSREWVQDMSLEQLGISVSPSNRLSIKLARKFFTYEGTDYALLHYQVPAFSYSLKDGTPVVHWGQGVALTDPGFGIIYWNASLQRAVAQRPGSALSRLPEK